MADSGFLIDGLRYEVPSLDSFNMGEAKILYKCSGLALEDFAVDERDPEARDRLAANIRNPGFIEALMVVAYLRGNGGMSEARAMSVIQNANLVQAIESFVDSVVGDAGPPAPSEDTLTSSPSSTSGEDSPNGSAEPVTIQRPTGITG